MEVAVFPELSCFFHDPADVGHLISGSSAFSTQEGRVLGGRRGDKGGASVGQRGGAEALRSTLLPFELL